ALVGFEKVSFVGLGDAVQTPRPVVLDPGEEAVAPPETGVAMNTGFAGRLANGQGSKDLLHKRQPLGLVPQPRQRRAGQRVKGLGAGAAAVTLKAIGVTVPMDLLMRAVWTLRC